MCVYLGSRVVSFVCASRRSRATDRILFYQAARGSQSGMCRSEVRGLTGACPWPSNHATPTWTCCFRFMLAWFARSSPSPAPDPASSIRSHVLLSASHRLRLGPAEPHVVAIAGVVGGAAAWGFRISRTVCSHSSANAFTVRCCTPAVTHIVF